MSDINFVTDELIDLSNCDREPIHIPGKIQPYGVLLVLQNPQLTILQASKNTEEFLGIAAQSLIGQNLTVLFPIAEIQGLSEKIASNTLEDFYRLQLTTNNRFFDGIIHQSQGVLILELEPKVADELNYFSSFYQLAKASLAKILNVESFEEFIRVLAQEVRKITGYDRVMVYRFETDESGIIIAEDKKAELEPYLDLHYPASDIPQQARKLYYQNWLRIIVDVNYQPIEIIPINNPLTDVPLDLSHSFLRSISPIHIKYLQNMGVTASLCISLIDEKKLWGLVVCHHYQPKYIDYETRKACEFLGQFISLELFKQQQRNLEYYQEKVKLIQQKFKQSLLIDNEPIRQIFQNSEESLLELVNATGAVVCLNELILLGNTPPQETVQALVKWFCNHHQEEVFYTDSLYQIYSEAENFKGQISGLLVISIFLNQTSYHIMWFRPEIIQTVNWGGNPNKPVIQEDNNNTIRLSPRKSFELWKETVQGKSLPWSLLEIDAALELRSTLMLTMLEFSQAALEQASRAELANRAKSEFLANMSYEIRTPINASLGFCDLLQELIDDPKQHTYLDSIADSGKSLLALINDILDLSKIESGKLQLHYESLDLRRLIQEIEQIFSEKASQKGLLLLLEVEEDVPERIIFDEVRLRQILFNIIGNALKFTEQGYIKTSVRCQIEPNQNDRRVRLEITVEDTGVGIANEQRQQIFEAFEQSEGQSTRKYGGTGLGLTITKRLTQMLGGMIQLQSELGKGSKFTFIFPNVTVADINKRRTEESNH